MSHVWRMTRLCLSLANRGRWRFAMATTMLFLSLTVFLSITAFSTATNDALDRSVQQDLGALGTYRLSVRSDTGMSDAEVIAALEQAVRGLARAPATTVYSVAGAVTSCGPEGPATGATVWLIVSGDSTAFAPQPVGGGVCLNGLDVSDYARPTTQLENRLLGTGLVLDAAVLREASLTPGSQTQIQLLVTTGEAADMSRTLQLRGEAALSEASALNAQSSEGLVSVRRTDDGSNVREATANVAWALNLVGAGVLLIASVGLLLTELAIVRERQWMYGLSRALGGTRADIALLVVLDIVLVVLLGYLMTAAVAWLASPWVDEFAVQTIGVHASLLHAKDLTLLAGGGLAVLLAASLVPVLRAVKSDPLDLLEQPVV